MPGSARLTPIDQVATTLGTTLTPLTKNFSYYATSPLSPEDIREYLEEPIGALPPLVCEAIGPVRIVLTSFLQRVGSDNLPAVADAEPAETHRLRSAYLLGPEPTLFFAIGEGNPSEYHEIFFNTIAHLLSRRVDKDIQGKYASLLLTEIEQHVRGEVDDAGWECKQNLPRRGSHDRANTKSKQFREYVAQSFTDTMTLYLHGICCDIDVETGPRQMPSRWLRKRLEALYVMFPPPNGRPLLPEHLAKR